MRIIKLDKIAIIPARSGSKGLKDKNVKIFHGKPLMAWTIEAALKSGVFDKVIVSTDSVEYKVIAEEYVEPFVADGVLPSNVYLIVTPVVSQDIVACIFSTTIEGVATLTFTPLVQTMPSMHSSKGVHRLTFKSFIIF